MSTDRCLAVLTGRHNHVQSHHVFEGRSCSHLETHRKKAPKRKKRCCFSELHKVGVTHIRGSGRKYIIEVWRPPASRKAYGERLVLGWPTETEGPQEQLDVCSRTAHGERSLLTGYWWNSETPACSHPSASRIGEAAATEIRIYDPGEDLGFLPFWVMLRGSATDLAPVVISSGNQEVQAVAGRAVQTIFVVVLISPAADR